MKNDEDPRRYRVRLNHEYFAGWERAGWETVKRFATWTTDPRKATTFRLSEAESAGYMDLVCGFSGLELEEVK